MNYELLSNKKILTHQHLPTPETVLSDLAPSPDAIDTVIRSRAVIKNILHHHDPRLLVVVGPCSVHDPAAALEYAKRLNELQEKVASTMFLVMRTYFEKPRTVGGWKGLINDPHLDGSFCIGEGIVQARSLLLEVANLGIPAAVEMLDLIMPQYLADLVSWSAIGARTTESQSHRELASGLSMPVGFKNGTKGGIDIAVNAIQSAALQHHFLSIDLDGKAALFGTAGNPDCHIVLRGGLTPNYDAASVARCEDALRAAGITPAIMIDCSHANSGKDHRKQPEVFNSIIEQRTSGTKSIVGIMLESNINEGAQAFSSDRSALKHGVSITDACLGWEETEEILLRAHELLKA
jgi:3-deoxy-7-phosphoheptulonate synthase